MTEIRDDFARSSAARAWKAARDLQGCVDALTERLAALENARTARLNQCAYCGDWTTGVVCRNHADLLSTQDVLEKALGA